ncbi:hypothetical protein HPB48_019962 [Haemaphysalis longicornis]|uniref:Uncharacterized protein n=1 Tax=Haemaphysalis longicornis TaxID=44386 RepID=A0A9J6GBL3_HAELO|nr:hypothetical protein HPB48_019962 [Haemaphysalis longicornis]
MKTCWRSNTILVGTSDEAQALRLLRMSAIPLNTRPTLPVRAYEVPNNQISSGVIFNCTPDESNDTLMTALQCELDDILAAQGMGHRGAVLITFAATVPPRTVVYRADSTGGTVSTKIPRTPKLPHAWETRTSLAPPSTLSVLDVEMRRTLRNDHIAVPPRNSTASSVRPMVPSLSILPAPKTRPTRRENNCRSKNARGTAIVAFRSHGNRRTN